MGVDGVFPVGSSLRDIQAFISRPPGRTKPSRPWRRRGPPSTTRPTSRPSEQEHWDARTGDDGAGGAQLELIAAKLHGRRPSGRTSGRRSTSKRWDAAGFHPDQVKSASTTCSASPSSPRKTCGRTSSRTLRSAATSATTGQNILRVHGSSGTTGIPTVIAISRDDWARIGEAHARVEWGAGVRPSDTVFVAVAVQPLHGLVGDAGRGGADGREVLPVRGGGPGTDAHGRPLVPHGHAVGVLRHSLVLRSTSPKRRGRRASTRARSGSASLFFSGEPGASIPSTRKTLEDVVWQPGGRSTAARRARCRRG